MHVKDNIAIDFVTVILAILCYVDFTIPDCLQTSRIDLEGVNQVFPNNM